MALFAASCSNEDLEQMTKAEIPPLTRQETARGIAPEISNLKSSDAEIVANRFVSFFNSRSGDRTIKNVVTIPDYEGEPALYAVNFDNAYYPNFKYMLSSSYDKYSESQTMYHMNWGWGGQHDGYFIDNNISLMTKKYGLVNYKNSRKDIYITKP